MHSSVVPRFPSQHFLLAEDHMTDDYGPRGRLILLMSWGGGQKDDFL